MASSAAARPIARAVDTVITFRDIRVTSHRSLPPAYGAAIATFIISYITCKTDEWKPNLRTCPGERTRPVGMSARGTAERLTAERNLFYNCYHKCHRAGRRLP